MPKNQTISIETRESILRATFQLVVETGSLELTQSEIAAAAGVSRQTIYLAFGGRPGLLVAMLDYMDAQSDVIPRLVAAREAADGSWQGFAAYLDEWFEFLEYIYPVAILLSGAARVENEAAQAYWQRMHGRVRMMMRQHTHKIFRAGNLRADLNADVAGDIAWCQVQPSVWHLLVTETGWSAAEFAERQKHVIRHAIMDLPDVR